MDCLEGVMWIRKKDGRISDDLWLQVLCDRQVLAGREGYRKTERV